MLLLLLRLMLVLVLLLLLLVLFDGVGVLIDVVFNVLVGVVFVCSC